MEGAGRLVSSFRLGFALHVEGDASADLGLGAYARVALAWGRLAVFAQYGFGFESNDRQFPDLVAWSSRVQVGLDISLR